jgi:rare lipoprotein A (peptidoglycan hydrolase)
MLKVKLAAIAAALFLIPVGAAEAMTFADRPGTPLATIPASSKTQAMRFEHRPGYAGSPRPSDVATAAPGFKFHDRPGFAGPPVRRDLSAAAPVFKFEDRPGYSGPPVARASLATLPSFKFEHRPGPLPAPRVTASTAVLLLPMGWAEFCAVDECDALSFARRRAVLTPVDWNDHRVLAYVSTGIAYHRLPVTQPAELPPQWRLSLTTDHCNLMSLPKRHHLACLGLPGERLKDKTGFGSPLFKRAGLIPRGGGRFTIGRPYSISGRVFRPKQDPNYDQTGIASWYGGGFHRRMTANGEWFDMEYYSAAHPTMPLPSYARVTNLANGREMIVRVNDRGPFVGRRIIDLSKKCAEVLEFKKRGTTKVRVQYVGPAPLDDRGSHLAAMNRELERGTPQDQMIAAASGLRHQALLVNSLKRSYTE